MLLSGLKFSKNKLRVYTSFSEVEGVMLY